MNLPRMTTVEATLSLQHSDDGVWFEFRVPGGKGHTLVHLDTIIGGRGPIVEAAIRERVLAQFAPPLMPSEVMAVIGDLLTGEQYAEVRRQLATM